MKRILLSTLTSALLTSTAYAGTTDIAPVVPIIDIPEIVVEDEFVNLGLYTLGLKVGTLGIGLDASVPLSKFTDAPIAKHFNLRGNINGFSYSHNLDEFTDEIEEIDLSAMTSDGQIDLLTVGLLLDYYPFEQAQFRFTAGAYYNGNQIGIDANGNASDIELEDSDYTITGNVAVDISSKLDTIAPYIGMGWGNRGAEAGWSWSLDIGAMYQNIPALEGNIDAKGTIEKDNIVIDLPSLKNDYQDALSEASNEIENDENAKYTKWYPVIAFGITYSF